MCGDDHDSKHDAQTGKQAFQYDNENEIAPEYEQVTLPAPELLSLLVDAHCHPTDLNFPDEDLESVGLGGLCAMATRTDDQDKVERLAGKPRSEGQTKIIACFGHHPWFAHHFTLADNAPSKFDHYSSIWLPASSSPNFTSQKQLLETLLPYLPEPLAASTAIQKLRSQLSRAKQAGQQCMLGEVGIDKVARVTWPQDAPAPPDQEMKKLTPFKTSMAHQKQWCLMQMEIAMELGVNVSLHGVAAAAAVLEVLDVMHKRHKKRFIESINVDLHSVAGLHPNSLRDVQKQLPNIYISISLALNSTNAKGVPQIQTADPKRLLVESDTHDIRQCDRRVWGAVQWIAQVKGWSLEETVELLADNWRRFNGGAA